MELDEIKLFAVKLVYVFTFALLTVAVPVKLTVSPLTRLPAVNPVPANVAVVSYTRVPVILIGRGVIVNAVLFPAAWTRV